MPPTITMTFDDGAQEFINELKKKGFTEKAIFVTALAFVQLASQGKLATIDKNGKIVEKVNLEKFLL